MKKRWPEGMVVLAVVAGLLGCAGPVPKPGLLGTRGPGDARLYFLEGEDRRELRIEQTVTVGGALYEGYDRATVKLAPIPEIQWAVEGQTVLEDTFDRLVFSRPQDDEVLVWEKAPTEKGRTLMEYSWNEPPAEATATRLATVEYTRNHGPLVSAAPFPYDNWPDVVRRDLELGRQLGDEDPIVKETAEEITAGCAWELEAVAKIFSWVKWTIASYCHAEIDELFEDYVYGDVAWALRNRATGTCLLVADLDIALLRNLGIPARHVTVLPYAAVESSGAHAGVEVYFPDLGWVSFDPNREEYVFSDSIQIGHDGSSMSSFRIDQAFSVETLSAPVEARTVSHEVEMARPALHVFYIELSAPGTYHIDVSYLGSDAGPDVAEVFPDTIDYELISTATYPICFLRKASARHQTFTISLREDPAQSLTLTCEAVEPHTKPPFLLEGWVDPILGDIESSFCFRVTSCRDPFGQSSIIHPHLELKADDEKYSMMAQASDSNAAKPFYTAVRPQVAGIYGYKFVAALGDLSARGETGWYVGPEVNPPPGEGGSELGDRFHPTGDTAGVLPLLEKKFAVNVTGSVQSPGIDATVTNTDMRPLTNLVVEFSAVHLAEDRSLGIYRKNLGLVLPGRSKSTSWSPKLPAGTKPGALKIRARAYSIQEIGKGRSRRDIGFREITFGDPPYGPSQPPQAPAGTPMQKGKSLREQFL